MSSFVQANPLHTDIERIVSLGSNVTEIVYALNQEHLLVGTDSSSTYPPEATTLPQVGYYRSTPLEGIISLAPSMVLASEYTAPQKTLDDLVMLGVRVHKITDRPEEGYIYQRIQHIADILHCKEKGKSLINIVQQRIKQAKDISAPRLKTAFLVYYSGGILTTGQNTHPNAIIQLSGMENVYGHLKGIRTLSNESLITSAPELIITPQFSIENAGGLENCKKLPAIANSPAVKHNRVLVLDNHLIMLMGLQIDETIRQIKTLAQHDKLSIFSQ